MLEHTNRDSILQHSCEKTAVNHDQSEKSAMIAPSLLLREQAEQLCTPSKSVIHVEREVKTTPMKTPTKGILDRLPSVTEFAKASRDEVTHIEAVRLLADLYSRCIDGEAYSLYEHKFIIGCPHRKLISKTVGKIFIINTEISKNAIFVR